MSCGQLLDVIPYIIEGYLPWTAEHIRLYWSCVVIA